MKKENTYKFNFSSFKYDLQSVSDLAQIVDAILSFIKVMNIEIKEENYHKLTDYQKKFWKKVK